MGHNQHSKWGKRSTGMPLTFIISTPRFPFPPPSHPPHLPSPLLRSTRPLNQARGLGSTVSFHSGVRDGAPCRKHISVIFCQTHLDATVLMIFPTNFVHCRVNSKFCSCWAAYSIPVWQSVRKKWRYDFKPTKEVPVYHIGVYRLTSSPGHNGRNVQGHIKIIGTIIVQLRLHLIYVK